MTQRKAQLVKVVFNRTDIRVHKTYAKDVHQLWAVTGIKGMSNEEAMDLQTSLDERFGSDFKEFHKAVVREGEGVVELAFRFSADKPTLIPLDEEVAPAMADNLEDIVEALSEFCAGGVKVPKKVEHVASEPPKKGGGRRKLKTEAKAAAPKKSKKKAAPKKGKKKAAPKKTAPKKEKTVKAAAPKKSKKKTAPKKEKTVKAAAPKVDLGMQPLRQDEDVVVATRFRGDGTATVQLVGRYVVGRIKAVQDRTRGVNEALQAAIRVDDPAEVVDKYMAELAQLRAVEKELRGVLDIAK